MRKGLLGFFLELAIKAFAPHLIGWLNDLMGQKERVAADEKRSRDILEKARSDLAREPLDAKRDRLRNSYSRPDDSGS